MSVVVPRHTTDAIVVPLDRGESALAREAFSASALEDWYAHKFAPISFMDHLRDHLIMRRPVVVRFTHSGLTYVGSGIVKNLTMTDFSTGAELKVRIQGASQLVQAVEDTTEGLRRQVADLKAEREGIRRYTNGEPLQFSTGIHGALTYGYGNLDSNGFWEFPVPFDFLNLKQQAHVRQTDRIRTDGIL